MKRRWPKDKVVSIMTTCTICEKDITKKNFEDGIFLCEECINLSIVERVEKLNTIIKNKALDEYIDLLKCLEDIPEKE